MPEWILLLIVLEPTCSNSKVSVIGHLSILNLISSFTECVFRFRLRKSLLNCMQACCITDIRLGLFRLKLHQVGSSRLSKEEGVNLLVVTYFLFLIVTVFC